MVGEVGVAKHAHDVPKPSPCSLTILASSAALIPALNLQYAAWGGSRHPRTNTQLLTTRPAYSIKILEKNLVVDRRPFY